MTLVTKSCCSDWVKQLILYGAVVVRCHPNTMTNTRVWERESSCRLESLSTITQGAARDSERFRRFARCNLAASRRASSFNWREGRGKAADPYRTERPGPIQAGVPAHVCRAAVLGIIATTDRKCAHPRRFVNVTPNFNTATSLGPRPKPQWAVLEGNDEVLCQIS